MMIVCSKSSQCDSRLPIDDFEISFRSPSDVEGEPRLRIVPKFVVWPTIGDAPGNVVQFDVIVSLRERSGRELIERFRGQWGDETTVEHLTEFSDQVSKMRQELSGSVRLPTLDGTTAIGLRVLNAARGIILVDAALSSPNGRWWDDGMRTDGDWSSMAFDLASLRIGFLTDQSYLREVVTEIGSFLNFLSSLKEED